MGNLLLGNEVNTNNGVQLENPFFRSVETSLAATWCIENRGRVERGIIRSLQKVGVSHIHVVDCFDHVVNYFIENPHNDYKDTYYDSDTYSIDRYVMSRVERETFTFAHTIKKRQNEFYLHDSEDGETTYAQTMSPDYAKSRQLDKDFELDSIESLIEFDDLQSILDNELDIYNDDLQSYDGMRGFQLRKYVEVVFLKGLISEGNDADKIVAEAMGVKEFRVKNWRKQFKKIVMENKKEYEDLKQNIIRLMHGVAKGWNPKFSI